MDSVWAKLAEYGLAGIVISVLFFILWQIICFAKTSMKEMNDQHNAERCMWLKTLDALNASIQIHQQGSVEARKQAEEAHNYQREEHREMILSLGRINGYKKE